MTIVRKSRHSLPPPFLLFEFVFECDCGCFTHNNYVIRLVTCLVQSLDSFPTLLGSAQALLKSRHSRDVYIYMDKNNDVHEVTN